MRRTRNQTLTTGCGALLAFVVFVSSANSDTVKLNSGEQLGEPGHFIYLTDGKLVIADASGTSEFILLTDVASMELSGRRELRLTNGDVLHVENVAVEEENVRFTSDLLGENEVPVEAVVSLSQPEGQKVSETPLQAAQEPEPPPKKWSGKVQFGYASTSGREDTQNTNLATETVREAGRTRLTLKASARYGETSGEKTVDAQEAAGKFDLFLTERVYWYWDLGLLRDSINLIDLRLSPGIGVGRKFITGERFSLEGEAGVNAIWERQALVSGAKETETNWYGRLAGRFTWKLGRGAEFSQEVEVLPGLSSGDEFRYRSVSQLTAPLTRRLSLAAGFTVDYDNRPPEGVPRTSTNASTGFIYSF